MRAEQWRGLDFYSPTRQDKVLVIGVGHIGSFVTYYLARLGVKDITVVDFDVVESHNLPHQFLAESLVKDVSEDTRILKVDILKQSVDFMVRDANVKYIPSKIEDAYREVMQNPPTAIFVCVDSMLVRKWIFDNFKICNCLFVDVRTGGQFVNVYSIMGTKSDYGYYENSLYSDDEVAPLPCTGTAIIDVAAASSAEAVNRFRLWTNDKLQLAHTFHDYSTGIHSVMQYRNLVTNIPVNTGSDSVVVTPHFDDIDNATSSYRRNNDVDGDIEDESEDSPDEGGDRELDDLREMGDRFADEDAGQDR